MGCGMDRTQPFLIPGAPARVELLLQTAEGAPWRLRLSAGMERFVGAYPRLPGIVSEGPLLAFRTVSPA